MTDLLDGWEDGSVELPPPAGMSPERIKERTMEQIRQTKRPRRRMGVRLLACAALAAVFTVSAMAAYHLWGPGELFDPFFTLESAPLDDGQKELLDQIGATNLPPVTSNGVTLTPLAAIADEHTLYLRLRLEAPEGTVLPDMGEQEDHIAHGVGLVDADTGERLNWGMQKARFLPDDTPGDNSLELVFMLLGGPNGANWVDGTSKTLTITDLILCPREPEDAEKTYLEGEWSFSLDSFYQGKEVEINTIGAVRWDEETERMVTLEGLTRSPLAASYTISYPVEESWEFVDLQLELVYKDGSSVTIDGGGGKGSHGPDGQGGTDYFTGVRNFDAPLDLRELDHLQYGGCRLEDFSANPERWWKRTPLGRCGTMRRTRTHWCWKSCPSPPSASPTACTMTPRRAPPWPTPGSAWCWPTGRKSLWMAAAARRAGPLWRAPPTLTRPSPWNGWITFCLAISGLSWNKYGKKCPPAPQRGTFLPKNGQEDGQG